MKLAALQCCHHSPHTWLRGHPRHRIHSYIHNVSPRLCTGQHRGHPCTGRVMSVDVNGVATLYKEVMAVSKSRNLLLSVECIEAIKLAMDQIGSQIGTVGIRTLQTKTSFVRTLVQNSIHERWDSQCVEWQHADVDESCASEGRAICAHVMLVNNGEYQYKRRNMRVKQRKEWVPYGKGVGFTKEDETGNNVRSGGTNSRNDRSC
uniref:Uncharacterized protein n=1 Tax=Timema shepardi TaxID=629360 RepID=A0A7R9G256_TIMSH|nr:unnamed protein product [Timema shepardi]